MSRVGQGKPSALGLGEMGNGFAARAKGARDRKMEMVTVGRCILVDNSKSEGFSQRGEKSGGEIEGMAGL